VTSSVSLTKGKPRGRTGRSPGYRRCPILIALFAGCPISRASFAREVGGVPRLQLLITPVLSRILSSQQVPHRRPSSVRNDIPYLWGFRILLFRSSVPFSGRLPSALPPVDFAPGRRWAITYRRSAAGASGLDRMRPSLHNRGGFSFVPPGLVPFLSATHGLRRGLHSFAAPRLSSRDRCPDTIAVPASSSG
jgi:hypothetical protein